MKFNVVNLGCKVNRVESDAAAAALLAHGGEAVPEAEADLIVVNTCTVTGEAEKKTRKAVRHALRANDRARVVVTGCAAAIDPKTYAAMDARVEVVPKNLLVERATEMLGQAADPARGARSLPHEDGGLPELLRTGEGFRTRVGIKVQDGCDNACTYCIVHVARGRAASRPAAEIATIAQAYAHAGVKEIVLTGINLGSYRGASGFDGEMSLASLLRQLLDATAGTEGSGAPPCRFRLSSIEPRDLDDDLIALIAEADGRICRHLHLPLQAGSDKVLREMARPYDAAFFADLTDRLYERVPSLALSTDIIAGFPGETDGEFAQTLALARHCRFSKIHAFPYSRREGTPAAARADQVPPEVKAARAAALRALGDELRAADYARRAGTSELALVEEDGIAMTESYYEVVAPKGAAAGSLVRMVLPRENARTCEASAKGR